MKLYEIELDMAVDAYQLKTACEALTRGRHATYEVIAALGPCGWPTVTLRSESLAELREMVVDYCGGDEDEATWLMEEVDP